MPGVRISKRLGIASLFFLGLLIMIAVAGPRVHLFQHQSVPTVETMKLSAPQEQPVIQPYHAPSFKPVLPINNTRAETKKPTCQPCIQAAQEVLTRYLSAIRTGAGADETLELPNVLETERVYPTVNSMYGSSVLGNSQLYGQRVKQLYSARALPGPFSAAR